ncbi:MAG: hypothetical protein V1809_09605 [Planctomycetota bacterium]
MMGDGVFSFCPALGLIVFLLVCLTCGMAFFPLVRRAMGYADISDSGQAAVVYGVSFACGAVLWGTVARYVSWFIGVNVLGHAFMFSVWFCMGVCGAYQFFRACRINSDDITRKKLMVAPIVLLGLPTIVMAIAVLSPYVFSDDATCYVSMVKFLFQEGSLEGTKANCFSNFPLLGSQIGTLFYPLFGLSAVKMFQFISMIVATSLIYGLIFRTTGRYGLAIIGAFAFITLPLHFQVAHLACSDRMYAFLVISGLGLFLMPDMTVECQIVGVIALLSGAAVAKHTGLFLLLSGGGVAFIRLCVVCRSDWKRILIVGTGALVVSGFVLFPWYGRSWIETGDVFFPLGHAAHSPWLTNEQQLYWSRILLFLKISISEFCRSFWAYSGNRWDDANTPVVVMLIPVLLVAILKYPRRMVRGWGWLITVLLLYFVLCLMKGIPRYRYLIYPVHSVLIVMGMLGIAAVFRNWRAAALLGALAGACFVMQSGWIVKVTKMHFPFACGRMSRDEFLAKHYVLGGDGDVLIFKNHVSKNDRVAIAGFAMNPILWMPGRIFLTQDSVEGTTRWALPSVRAVFRDSGSIGDWLDRNGVDVVVVPREYLKEGNPDERGVLVVAGERRVLIRKKEVANRVSADGKLAPSNK